MKDFLKNFSNNQLHFMRTNDGLMVFIVLVLHES